MRKNSVEPVVAAMTASTVPRNGPNMKPPAAVRMPAPGKDTATAAA